MVHRHRIPTVFSIYMLDVICCALGCVILLWQVAHQNAEEQTANAQQQASAAKAAHEEAEEQSSLFRLARSQYETAQRELLAASNDKTQLQALIAMLEQKNLKVASSLAQTEKDREEARRLAAVRQEEIDKTRRALALNQDQLKKLEQDLAKLLASNKKTTADLTGVVKINTELLAKIALAEKRIDTLKKDVSEKETEIASATKKWKGEVALLKISEENARKLQNLLDAVRDENKDTQDKLKARELEVLVRQQEVDRVRGEMSLREKELARVRGDRDGLLISTEKLGQEKSLTLKELLDSKKRIEALTVERDAWKSEVEQRFAGVPLTGESVIFLIDASGSMSKKDSKTDDPDKWPFLCDTLMQLMRSIPTMKRFQVILFAEKTHYLFGNRDGWYTYEGPNSAQTVRNSLKKYAVGGGTNMHDAFEEAFRYRKMGLDTIYVFSDGLPNIGAGVPSDITNPTEEQLNHHLARYVREKLLKEWNQPVEGKQPVRVNAIGFYFESPDVGAFLWALAREHRGSFVGIR